MNSLLQIATAPCSWGVDFADHPANPPWQKVLDEAASAGFKAIDLGPVGYFPTEPTRLRDELDARGLWLSAGGLFDPFSDANAFTSIVEKTRRTCGVLTALDVSRLVVIEGVTPARAKTAGQSDRAPRLSPDSWKQMMVRITQVARIAWEEFGVRSYLHAHGGSYIEFGDEIDHAMADLPPDLVSLCVDTGHSAYAGIDPIDLLAKFAPRVGHLHFKDINPLVRTSCLSEQVDFFSAVERGIFSRLGEGCVNFPDVATALQKESFSGYAVIEQDVDPASTQSSLRDAKANLEYLRSVGLA